ncbi:MAG: hypothetical protein AAGC55_04795, partial [Myxococcota bacterium]
VYRGQAYRGQVYRGVAALTCRAVHNRHFQRRFSTAASRMASRLSSFLDALRIAAGILSESQSVNEYSFLLRKRSRVF